MPFKSSRRGSIGNQNNHKLAEAKLTLGTPKMFGLGNKIVTTTTPKGRLPQNDLFGKGSLFSTNRNYNFNSGLTFNVGSRINTKTHAQQTQGAGRGNLLITPKVSNIGNDPETHRILLEKLNTDLNN